jgi:hypothetical protein
MIENNIFHYRKAAPYNVFPGAHASKVVGNGLLFKHHQPLIAAPDPRHIDLRASLLNPFAEYQVKSFQQQSRLDVFLLADLSASMGFHGNYNKLQAVIDCLLSVAKSAHATGDRFGFVGCGQVLNQQLLISPANLQQGRVIDIAQRIKATVFTGKANSLLQAADYLPNSSALVFLLSDFYMPIKIIQQQMQRLNKHTVVPLVTVSDILLQICHQNRSELALKEPCGAFLFLRKVMLNSRQLMRILCLIGKFNLIAQNKFGD